MTDHCPRKWLARVPGVSGRQLRVFGYLLQSDTWIARRELRDFTFRDIEPEGSDVLLSDAIKRLNDKIRPLNWEVAGRRMEAQNAAKEYRLQPRETADA